MADETKKYISTDDHLKAFALFSMAQDHYAKGREFERALAELLNIDDEYYCGCISDEMQDPNGNFERGLKNEGYAVRPPAKKQKR